jgi:hypothetical protein
VRLVGVALSEKSDGGLTTKVTDVVRVRLPLVPVTVMGYDPAGVVVAVLRVIVVVPLVVTVAGLKLLEAPAGRPLALKLTVPLNPLLGVTVIV